MKASLRIAPGAALLGAALIASIACRDKNDTVREETPAGTVETHTYDQPKTEAARTEAKVERKIEQHTEGMRTQEPAGSVPTIAPTGASAAPVNGAQFATAELKTIEGKKPVQAKALFFGDPSRARMVFTASGLDAGSYGVFLGKDCKPATQRYDTNAADNKGVGSATVREGELRLGTLEVDDKGNGRLDAVVPYHYADEPPIYQRSVILMPASADKVGAAQTMVACGSITKTEPDTAG